MVIQVIERNLIPKRLGNVNPRSENATMISKHRLVNAGPNARTLIPPLHNRFCQKLISEALRSLNEKMPHQCDIKIAHRKQLAVMAEQVMPHSL